MVGRDQNNIDFGETAPFRVSSSSHGLPQPTIEKGLMRHRHMQKNFHEQSLTAMNTGFANLQLSQKSNFVKTRAKGPTDYDGHVQDLKAEINHMVCTIANPLVQPGLEMALNSALQEYLAMVKGKFYPNDDMEGSQMIPSQCLNRITFGVNVRTASFPESLGSEEGANIKDKSAQTPRHIHREGIRAQQVSYTIKTSFGAVYFRSRTFRIRKRFNSETGRSNDQYEFETYFTWHPAPWLMRLGIKFGVNASISKSYWGWKNTLNTFSAVPDDSLIFDFCKTGNIGGVQTLLTRGKASVRDTNSQGWTPLHVSE